MILGDKLEVIREISWKIVDSHGLDSGLAYMNSVLVLILNIGYWS